MSVTNTRKNINMKTKSLIFSAFFICCGSFSRAQTSITVAAGDNAANPTISKYIYSHFAEHLGHGIYEGFYVGDTSHIPNTYGIRNDVIAALKKNEDSRVKVAGWLLCRYLPLEGWCWPQG